jgi:hypothetical protein
MMEMEAYKKGHKFCPLTRDRTLPRTGAMEMIHLAVALPAQFHTIISET